jgi:hypothetical protein
MFGERVGSVDIAPEGDVQIELAQKMPKLQELLQLHDQLKQLTHNLLHQVADWDETKVQLDETKADREETKANWGRKESNWDETKANWDETNVSDSFVLDFRLIRSQM